ncbi:UDP-glucuronosyltransferase 1A8-like [Artemia franciscana]|uniref:Uncharacterized protein n=1 Tax=Artemia franciscana TaxID=6661 RepID=A0AA88H5M5_ARTSF|nr:hypothetical protein QYM36_017415 [Artemia franciscana]
MMLLLFLALISCTKCQNILIITLGSGEDRYLAYQSAKILTTTGVNVTLLATGDTGPPMPGLEMVIIPSMAEEKGLKHKSEGDIFCLHSEHLLDTASESLQLCNMLYYNNFAQTILEKTNYDLAIIALTFSDACILPLMKVMNFPVIGLATSFLDLPWVYYNADVPFPLSYVPVMSDIDPEEFTIFEKLRNFRRWRNYLFEVDNVWRIPASKIVVDNLKQEFELSQLYDDIGLVLTASDLLMEEPMPLPPHILRAGCYYCLAPMEFEGVTKEFVENTKSGTVFITTDNPLDDERFVPPKDATQVLIDAVVKSGYSVIVTTSDPRLREHRPRPGVLYLRNPSRIDILGHPKTRLLISCCSFTETFEALYYGVPIICLPTTAAQKLASKRAAVLGAGEILQWSQLFQPEAHNVTQRLVTSLIKDKKYREALRHISTDVRDRPLTPLDVFIYWVNYAIRHKGHTHLRSETTKKLSLVSYYMIDVVALVALLIFIIFTTLTIFGIVWVKYYISNAAKLQKKHNE